MRISLLALPALCVALAACDPAPPSAPKAAEPTEHALAGGLEEWQQSPQGWLGLLILLGQLPRMIYRDTPRALSDATATRPSGRSAFRPHWVPSTPLTAHHRSCRHGPDRWSRRASSD